VITRRTEPFASVQKKLKRRHRTNAIVRVQQATWSRFCFMFGLFPVSIRLGRRDNHYAENNMCHPCRPDGLHADDVKRNRFERGRHTLLSGIDSVAGRVGQFSLRASYTQADVDESGRSHKSLLFLLDGRRDRVPPFISVVRR